MAGVLIRGNLNTDTHRENQVNTQGDGPLQAKERDLRRNPTASTVTLDFQPPKPGESKFVLSTPPS